MWYCITTNYFKGCCQDRTERFETSLHTQQPGWRLVTACDISPALREGCGFHGLQNTSGQTASPFPPQAADALSSLCFQVRHIATAEWLKSLLKAFCLYTHTCLCLQGQAPELYLAVPSILQSSSWSWIPAGMAMPTPSSTHCFCPGNEEGEACCLLGIRGSIWTLQTLRHFQAWLANKKPYYSFLMSI